MKKIGAFNDNAIIRLLDAGWIRGGSKDNVNPASYDLTITGEIYRVPAVFQVRKNTSVLDMINNFNGKKHNCNNPLLKDCTYLIRIKEKITLHGGMYGYANPKSTAGRLDLHVRLMADGVREYDTLPPGWKGDIWVMVTPRSHSVLLHPGESVNQIRFFFSDTRLHGHDLLLANSHYSFQRDPVSLDVITGNFSSFDDRSLLLSVDLTLEGPVAYAAKNTDAVIDYSKRNFYDPGDFYTSIMTDNGHVLLQKNAFYILSSKELITVPVHMSSEMLAVDVRLGDFRSHYAGFFDPGFGMAGDDSIGLPIVLEVRSPENMFIEHGQPMARIKYELLSNPAVKSYAILEKSNYNRQRGLKLAKQFKKQVLV
jgi:dCTP deaminase